MAFIFSTTIALTASAVWNDPTATAPGANAPTPVNTAGSQLKSGGLSVGSLIVNGAATLGNTALVCDSTTDGLIRFNSGVLEICSDQSQLEPLVATSTEPLLPASCSNGDLSVYNSTTLLWECGSAPQPLPECLEGELVLYGATGWECGQPATSKFVDGSNPTHATYNTGKVGIGIANPQAYLHIDDSDDLTLTSENHAATFGWSGSTNVSFDNDEIMARNNGAKASLFLQGDGGRLSFNNSFTSSARVQFESDGRVVIGAPNNSDNTGKLQINNTTALGPAGWYTSIKFTNNTHNAIWNPAGGLYFGMHSNGNFSWGDESGGSHEAYRMTLGSDTGDLTKTGTMRAAYLILNGAARSVYFGNGNQSVRGDNGSYIDYHSNHDTITQIIFRDKEDTQYGRVYGNDNGGNFGLLDGDGNWYYLADKDTNTQLVINNNVKTILHSNGHFGIGIGNATPAYRLDVANSSSGYIAYFRNQSTDIGADGVRLTMSVAGTLGADDHFASFRDNGGNLHGSIGGRNNGTQTLYWAASDRRLKENIETVNYDTALDILTKTRPVSFDWKSDGKNDLGYIAQEVKENFPLAAVGNEGEYEITEDENGSKKKIIKYMTVVKDKFIPVIHSVLSGNISKTKKMERLIEKEEEMIKKLEAQLDEQQKVIDEIAKKLD